MATQMPSYGAYQQVYGQQPEQGGFMGLLSSPVAQGLLGAGLGALASRGTKAQAIGRGGLLGLSAYGQAQDTQNNRLLQMAQAKLQQDALAKMTPGADGAISASPATFLQAGFSDPSKWADIRNAGRDKLKEIQQVTGADGSKSLYGVDEYGGVRNTGLANAPEIKTQDIGGQVIGWNPYTGQQASAVNKSLTPDQVQDTANQPFMMVNGQIVANPAYQAYSKAKAAAGASRTNVVVDAAPKAFWSDFGKQASDQLFKEREQAQGAAGTLQGIGELRKAVQGGAYQGTGADYKLAAAKALGSLGMQIAPGQVANSEQFNAVANQFVLNSIKSLGANPSNADREFIEKTVPRLSTDPNSLPLLLNYMEGKAKAQVDGYNNKIRGVQQQPGAGFMPFSLEVQSPQQPTQPSPKSNGGWGIHRVN